MRAFLTVALCAVLNLSGCAARYVLSDKDLNDAKTDDATELLRVYVSNQMIASYERKDFERRVIKREIRDRSQKRREHVRTDRNKTGGIVGEDLLNGARRIWVSFNRQCTDDTCAYGFVQTEDGRYRLHDVPPMEGYADPEVYRTCRRLKRHKMEMGKLTALSDANAVYKLKRRRKKRPKTIFLEVKKANQQRVKNRTRTEPGFD